MSEIKKQSLDNASEIIELFGGIRPMAKKMGVAVTTVQGWKKRNTIPAARYEDVIKSAKEHKITLKGIVGDADTSETSTQDNTPPLTSSEQPTQGANAATDPKPIPPNMQPGFSPIDETILHAELKKAQRAATIRGTVASLAILAVAIAAGAALFGGEIRTMINQQEKIKAIESEVSSLSQEVESQNQSVFKDLLPKNLEIDIEQMKIKSSQLQQQVEKLANQASSAAKDIANNDPQLENRISEIEKKLTQAQKKATQYARNTALPLLAANLEKLSGNANGLAQVNASLSQLNKIITEMQNQGLSIDEALAAAKAQDDTLNETFADVSGQELKAAAMLLTLTSMRNSLGRDNASFDQDLILMQKLTGEDNKELNLAIEILAPQAKNGVLTTSGLSGEFKSLAGDIVVASLKGEDVSIKDQTKAKINQVFSVEKNGELVTGTDTEKTVAQAQKLLDHGKVAEAITLLETLDGPAANKAKPFIKQAEMSLIAGEFYQLAVTKILPKLAGSSLINSTNQYLNDTIGQ